MNMKLIIKLFFSIILSTTFTNISLGADLYISDKNSGNDVLILNKEKENTSQNYSDKKLGSFFENGNTVFRLFTPNAHKVVLHTFKNAEDINSEEYEMTADEDGVWEVMLDGELNGLYYGYKVYNKHNISENGNAPLCIDPYSKAVATYNTFHNPRKSIVYEKSYDWENDKSIQRDWRDLIIYEMHVRDMTAHPSSKSDYPGTYKGLVQKNTTGGIDYIKNLGVNTVELLPAQEFGNMESPFNDSLNGKFNSWNPYERNHWGYMTAAFFAPEAYYSEDWKSFKHNVWMGTTGKQVNEFKNMVKAFHKEDIAVIMDVVYNHLSEYEIGNLKQIDKDYYFRLDDKGNFIAESYCGNDLKTEAPMMRRLIIDSILYWMKEYHIDGFRFDLGKLIDWETIEAVIREARKINPNVIFTCEPWGGGYDPQGFSMRGWSAWNDQIRNGIKGENPVDGLGWIFGKWYGNNNIERIKSYVNGTLIKDKHGLFQTKEHSVNYLESHDGYTLGDFIRIASGEVKRDSIINDINKNAALSPLQTKLNKLAALFLLTSQGITMIHSGQEFARSKVIPNNTDAKDPHKGMIDHNSYDKDNEANYINYNHAEINHDLFDYYKGLIELRKTYEAFRKADYGNIKFTELSYNKFALAYSIKYKEEEFLVMFNANKNIEAKFPIAENQWEILVNNKKAGTSSLGIAPAEIILNPVSGIVLKRK